MGLDESGWSVNRLDVCGSSDKLIKRDSNLPVYSEVSQISKFCMRSSKVGGEGV